MLKYSGQMDHQETAVNPSGHEGNGHIVWRRMGGQKTMAESHKAKQDFSFPVTKLAKLRKRGGTILY